MVLWYSVLYQRYPEAKTVNVQIHGDYKCQSIKLPHCENWLWICLWRKYFVWFYAASVNFTKSGSRFVECVFPGPQNPGSEECEETCLFLHHQDMSWLPPARTGKLLNSNQVATETCWVQLHSSVNPALIIPHIKRKVGHVALHQISIPELVPFSSPP